MINFTCTKSRSHHNIKSIVTTMKSFLTIAIIAISLLAIYIKSPLNENEELHRKLQVSLLDIIHTKSGETNNDKPKIYAFYSKQHDNDVSMANWATSWADKGWDPIVLTAADAEKNSAYKELKSTLDSRGDLSAKAKEKYLGYVAMSHTKEGGWFSELNVLPLNPGNMMELPNNGELTFHVSDGPALISSNQKGWKIYTHLMIQAAQESLEDALIEIKQNKNNGLPFIVEPRVMSAKQLFAPSFFYRDMCEFTQNKIAIRFAFYDMPKGLFDDREQNIMAEQWLRLHRVRCLSPHPIVFTFADGFPEDKIGSSTAELELWKRSWAEKGWEPFVLNLLDARRHPAYPELIKIFHQQQTPLGSFYEACYLRWLAIVASGGGWMSDIDVFPLHMPPEKALPNNGNMTSYERHIPCLISASAMEYDRVRILLQQSLIQHKDQFWSDLFGFQQISEQFNNVYIYGTEAVPINKIYANIIHQVPNEQQQQHSIDSMEHICPLTNKLRAIHFSPFAISQVIKGIQYEYKERSEFIQTWISNWNQQCDAPMHHLRKRFQEKGKLAHGLTYYNT